MRQVLIVQKEMSLLLQGIENLLLHEPEVEVRTVIADSWSPNIEDTSFLPNVIIVDENLSLTTLCSVLGFFKQVRNAELWLVDTKNNQVAVCESREGIMTSAADLITAIHRV